MHANVTVLYGTRFKTRPPSFLDESEGPQRPCFRSASSRWSSLFLVSQAVLIRDHLRRSIIRSRRTAPFTASCASTMIPFRKTHIRVQYPRSFILPLPSLITRPIPYAQTNHSHSIPVIQFPICSPACPLLNITRLRPSLRRHSDTGILTTWRQRVYFKVASTRSTTGIAIRCSR